MAETTVSCDIVNFSNLKQQLEANEARELLAQGHGKPKQCFSCFKETDEEFHWSSSHLGKRSSQGLEKVNFKNVTKSVGLLGTQQQYSMMVEDFNIITVVLIVL